MSKIADQKPSIKKLFKQSILSKLLSIVLHIKYYLELYILTLVNYFSSLGYYRFNVFK